MCKYTTFTSCDILQENRVFTIQLFKLYGKTVGYTSWLGSASLFNSRLHNVSPSLLVNSFHLSGVRPEQTLGLPPELAHSGARHGFYLSLVFSVPPASVGPLHGVKRLGKYLLS